MNQAIERKEVFMENIENTASEKSRNILVVYYSRTGTTRKVAEYITKQLGADMEEIIDMKKRSGIWGFL
ncbi:MAG: flavodoxin family protein, partial [Actinobacteria bacterium]|nr:flavodoxin family protein [Actinomycetota bacterium]